MYNIYVLYSIVCVVVSGEREKKRFTRLRRLYAGTGKAYYNMSAAVIFTLNIYAKEVINFFFLIYFFSF